MILIHQLWNQRRQNLWIFIELFIAGVFLWMVTDPIVKLTADRLIPSGSDPQGVYVLKLGKYDASFGTFYDAAQDSAGRMEANYLSILRAVRTLPEVEAVCVAAMGSYPNSGSWSGMQLFNEDTLMVHVQQYNFVQEEGSNLLKTYGMTDVHTGRPVELPVDFARRGKIALSEQAARRLFGTVDVVGRTVYEDQNLKNAREVAVVFRDYKHYAYQQPYPMIVQAGTELQESPYMGYMYTIVFRLKEGVDADAFEERFRQETAPRLSAGNFFFDSLNAFSEQNRQQALSSGVTNKLRLHYALGGFALLCIFLGMVGTFWIRANARREEVGIMRSLGASRGCIVRRFLTEAAVLVTLAYVLSLFVALNYVLVNGFTEPLQNFVTGRLVPDPMYWQNHIGGRFLAISLVSYALLMLTALVGTYIPVRRASQVSPVEALRDE